MTNKKKPTDVNFEQTLGEVKVKKVHKRPPEIIIAFIVNLYIFNPTTISIFTFQYSRQFKDNSFILLAIKRGNFFIFLQKSQTNNNRTFCM